MVRKVTSKQLGFLKDDLSREQKNMMYLMRPAVPIVSTVLRRRLTTK